ncbi:MAG TPA: hypothetical protein VG206_26665 [Terriglobia bacterium]|nr:hypothetical protein [Terriglobia bacterium]
MNAAVEFDLRELLTAAGAEFGRGKRPRCPRCKKLGTLSVDLANGVFCCHNSECDFRGNAVILAKAQGRLAHVSPAERRAQAEAHRRAREAAEITASRASAERQQLYATHRELLSIQEKADEWLRTNPDDQTAWSGLRFTDIQIPRVRAALGILEDAPIETRLKFLEAGAEEREAMIDVVIERGGILDDSGRFVEVAY